MQKKITLFTIFFTTLTVPSLLNQATTTPHNPHELQNIFTLIYQNATWGTNNHGEGFSGGGSLFESTKEYRKLLQEFIQKYHIKTVVDVGCGDWEFSKYMDWSQVDYLGFDIVAHVIQKNITRYGSKKIHFIQANFLTTNLPSADLLICKHVLQHLSNQDISSFLPQLKKFKYCLITNEADVDNQLKNNIDALPGATHQIDLRLPPFNVIGTKLLTYNLGGVTHQVFFINNHSNI